MAFKVRVSGAKACFARPEFRVDRISYDVITPFAARAILDAIYWRPQMRWRIDTIQVLNPIIFAEESASEPGSERISPRTIALADVDYVIEAHFDLIGPETSSGNAASHTKMFLKRVRAGQYFRKPFLGLPEFPATIALIEKTDAVPRSHLPAQGTRDIGWIAHDIDSNAPSGMRFFRALMEDGSIQVPPHDSCLLGT